MGRVKRCICTLYLCIYIYLYNGIYIITNSSRDRLIMSSYSGYGYILNVTGIVPIAI